MATLLLTSRNSWNTSESSDLRTPRSAGVFDRRTETPRSASSPTSGNASSNARSWPSASSAPPSAWASKSSSQPRPDRRKAARTVLLACSAALFSACDRAVLSTPVAMRHFRSTEEMREESFMSCTRASKMFLSSPLFASCAASAFAVSSFASTTCCKAASAMSLTSSREAVLASFWNLKIFPAFTPSMTFVALSSAASTTATASVSSLSNMTLVCICCAWA
mmetsp:Transcript_23042/g.71785  ORF Transcript_23042/g.71785 Transcript_23042/m.71785 type:complete len:222 (+) Transcript_23042:1108-1773(+)